MKKKKPPRNQQINYLNKAIQLYVIILLSVYPLYYNNYYFNILSSKYQFYLFLTSVLVPITLTSNLTKANFTNTKANIKAQLQTRIKPDRYLLLLLLTTTLSTLQSDFPMESLLGNKGRYVGLILTLLYGITYIIITRSLKFKPILMDLFLLTGILVCLFGITDYFKLDILGFKIKMAVSQKAIYTSTIGNINTYTAYVALIMSSAFILYNKATTTGKSIYYYIATIISFFAIIMGNSDNSYLAIAALFGLSPLYLFATWSGTKRYIITITSFIAVIKIIYMINQKFTTSVIGIQSLFNYIAVNPYLNVIFFILLTTILIIYIHTNILKKTIKEEIGIWLRIIWSTILILSIIGIAILLYKVNTTPYSNHNPLTEYLKFTDSWGTNRGYIWRKLLQLYREFSIPRKLFGYGPDTFGILMSLNFKEEMKATYNLVFDSAHNEYLQYLITTGLLGLVSYLLFLGSSLWYMIQKGRDNPYVMAIVFAVIVYSVQAVVNINLPIVAPIFMTLMMTGVAFCRNQT